MCGVSTDITPRKKVEAALQQSETRFRQLAESVRECFWVTEVGTWEVLYVSPAYERIWGQKCSHLYASPQAWLDGIHPNDRDRVASAFHEDATTGNYHEEYRVVRPDGEIRWVSDRGVPIYDETGSAIRVAGIAEDITTRRQLEQEVAAISSHERRRISRELHDSIGQQLTGLGFLAKSLSRRLARKLPAESAQADTIKAGIQEAISEVRRVVRGLAPVGLRRAWIERSAKITRGNGRRAVPGSLSVRLPSGRGN